MLSLSLGLSFDVHGPNATTESRISQAVEKGDVVVKVYRFKRYRLQTAHTERRERSQCWPYQHSDISIASSLYFRKCEFF